MTIVHIADGTTVDTTHIEQLAAALATSLSEAGAAAKQLTGAASLAIFKSHTMPPLTDTASRLRGLLMGPNSLVHLTERLAKLVKAVSWASSIYAENEARLAQILTPGPVTGLAPLLGPAILPALAGGELASWLVDERHIAPGVATQRRVARIANTVDPLTLPVAWLAAGSGGEISGYPTQRLALTLSFITGFSQLEGNVNVRAAGARRAALLPGPTRYVDLARQGLPLRAPTMKSPVRPLSLTHQLLPYLTGASPTHYRNTPSGISRYVGTLGRLNQLSQQRQEMMIQIDHVNRTDGREVWVVHIPGTSGGSDLLSANPSNHDANPMLLAGAPTDVQRAVKLAMDQAGVPTGARVVLTGHSQGGLAAMNLARDEAFTKRFHLTNVLTCGSPVGVLPVGSQVQTLHLENIADHIPALDGAPNEASPQHVTVQFTNSELGFAAEPDAHGMAGYQKAVKEMAASNDPRVRVPLQNFVAAIGLVGGGQVTSRMFAARRSEQVRPQPFKGRRK